LAAAVTERLVSLKRVETSRWRRCGQPSAMRTTPSSVTFTQ
jgi:hypothetical protein